MKAKPSKRPMMPLPVKKFLSGARLPFAPTRSQPVTTAEVLMIPQVKADREFLAGKAVGEPFEVLTAVPIPGLAAPVDLAAVDEMVSDILPGLQL